MIVSAANCPQAYARLYTKTSTARSSRENGSSGIRTLKFFRHK
jgi:hypothetical protein